MCKAGILALGADLYFSAFRQFEGLIRILQYQQTMQLGSSTGIPRILMDLTAHFVALMTLILTFRGRVNRQTAGRVVLPVLVVKFMLEVEVLQRQHKVHDGETQIMLSRNDTLMFLKSVLFLTIIVKVAFFDKDTTCIACDEWLPMRGNGNKSDASSTTEFYVHGEEKSSQPVESGNDDKKVKKKKHRDKKRK